MKQTRMKSIISAMKFLLVVLSVLCIKDSSLQHAGQKINVLLYYDALCPFSEIFIVEQLYPAYQKIGSSLNVEFVPYGNVDKKIVDGKIQYDCQHGPLECALNKLHACGLVRLSDQDKQVAFVHCIENQERKADDKTRANTCAPAVGLTVDDLLKCSTGTEGDELFEKLEEKSANNGQDKVPFFLFNGKYDPVVREQAYRNFLGTVCKMFSSPPPGCN